MRLLPAAGLALAATLTVAACGGGAASPSAPPSAAGGGSAATADALDGRTFLAQSATGYTIVPGSTISLSFEGVRIAASAGCNRMGAEYEIVDGALKVGPMMTTEMACEEPLMAQDQWLSSFLGGAVATLDGDTLTLAKDGVSLELLDEQVAVPDRELEGTTWTVTGVRTSDAMTSYGATATLTFENGTVNVNAGCNTGSGSYELGEGTISFGPVGTTKKLCEDPAMQLETAVLTVLGGQATYAIDGNELTLENGGTGLVLSAGS